MEMKQCVGLRFLLYKLRELEKGLIVHSVYRLIPIFRQFAKYPLIGVSVVHVRREGRDQRTLYCLFIGHTISTVMCLLCKKWKDEFKILALIGPCFK
jgi:hypothetical protein